MEKECWKYFLPLYKYETLGQCFALVNPGSLNKWELYLVPANLVLGEMWGESSLDVGAFKLVTSSATVECASGHGKGALIGGSPGTDEETLKLLSCTTEGKTTEHCKVKNEGQATGSTTVEMAVKTELTYTGTKTQAEKEEAPVGDLLSPASGKTLVTLVFEGECPLKSGTKVAIEGTTVAKIDPEANTEPIQVAKLLLPSTAITKTFKWESEGKVKEQSDGLKASGSSATAVGTESLELEEKKEEKGAEAEVEEIDKLGKVGVVSS
jgi:hypothetical protein